MMNFSLHENYEEYKLNIEDANFVFFATLDMIAETQNSIRPIHTHDYCELFHVIRGKIKIHTETNIFELNKGDCAFIPKCLPHTSEICGSSQRIAIPFFMKKSKNISDTKYFNAFNDIFKNEIIIFNNFMGADAFNRFAGCYYSDFADKSELIKTYLREIILLMKISASKNDTTYIPPVFDDTNYRNYIISNYFGINFTGKSLNDLANQLHLSCQQTQRIIKKLYGQTFRERMLFAKMRYAKSLLHTTDYTVSKIAAITGYTCTHSFFDAFKKHCGTTPNEYRKSMK